MVRTVSDQSDPVTVRLRRALGIGDRVPPGSVDAVFGREQEDVALAAWRAATAGHDRAVRARERTRRRATAVLHRAMRPLEPAYLERIEACIAAEDWGSLARFDGRDVARVAAARTKVDAALTRLDDATGRADAALASARASRTEATERLIATLGPGRAATITGLSRRRLAALRASR